MNNEAIKIFGDGNQTRDFIYIEDLIRAIIATSENETGGEIFQIATSCERTVNEVAKKLKGCLESFGIHLRLEYNAPRKGDVKRNYSDISKAKRILQWEAREDFKTGLEKTVKYFLNSVKI